MDYYPENYGAHAPFPEHLTFRERLKRLVLEKEKPGTTAFGRIAQRLAHYVVRPRMGQVVDFVPGGRILDVGCGSGRNVRLYQAIGWDVYGVEPSPAASAHARSQGLKVVTGTLLEARFEPSFFDAITMYQVLEHMPNPRDVLHECHRILKPGGKLVVSVPNIECYDSSVFGAGWIPLEVPLHLYHFSMSTLGRLLTECGFHLERIKPQYLFYSSTWVDYLRLIHGLRGAVRDGSLTWTEALRKALQASVQGFLIKPLRFTVSNDIAPRFAHYLHAYATKAKLTHHD